MDGGGRRSLHSYRARRVARCARLRGRTPAHPGVRTQDRWLVRTGQRPAAGTGGRTAVPQYCGITVGPPNGVRICRTVSAATLVPTDRAASTSRCCGARCSELSRTTVTTAATSATQTPVCRTQRDEQRRLVQPSDLDPAVPHPQRHFYEDRQGESGRQQQQPRPRRDRNQDRRAHGKDEQQQAQRR